MCVAAVLALGLLPRPCSAWAPRSVEAPPGIALDNSTGGGAVAPPGGAGGVEPDSRPNAAPSGRRSALMRSVVVPPAANLEIGEVPSATPQEEAAAATADAPEGGSAKSKKGGSPAVGAVIVLVPLIGLGGAGAWFAMRKPAASKGKTCAPAYSQKGQGKGKGKQAGLDSSQGAGPPGKGGGKGKSKSKKGAGAKGKAAKGAGKAAAPAEVAGSPDDAFADLMGDEAAFEPKNDYDQMEIKAAIRVQAMFRGWKARKLVAQKKTEGGPRPWQQNQRVRLLIDCVDGANMPNVNTFGGGCDPYVEFRLVEGSNPLTKSGGSAHTEPKPGTSVKTEVKGGDMTPSWNEKLELANVPIKKDAYLQIILWDHNMTGSTPIGHEGMLIEELLEGLTFDVKSEVPPKKAFKLEFKNLLEGSAPKVPPTVNCRFAFLEINQFNIKVAKAAKLPKVDTFGTCDAFIEMRVVRGSPRKLTFSQAPPDACLWSGKTQVVENSLDPKWNEDFEAFLPAYPGLYLQLVLWDSGALGNTAICQALQELDPILAKKPDSGPQESKLKFQKLVGVAAAGDFSKSRLTLKVDCKPLFEKDVG